MHHGVTVAPDNGGAARSRRTCARHIDITGSVNRSGCGIGDGRRRAEATCKKRSVCRADWLLSPTLKCSPHAHQATTLGACGAERCTFKRDVGARYIDASAQVIAVSGQRARDAYRATGTPIEHDGAVLAGYAAGADFTRHVHRLAQGLPYGGSLEHDRSAIGLDHAAISNQGLTVGCKRAGRQHHLQKSVTAQIERSRLSRTQRHFAQWGTDQSFVGHCAAQQSNRAAWAGNNLTSVDDRTTFATENVFAAHERGLVHAQRRGDEPRACIDQAGGGDGNTVLVNQINRAIGPQRTGDGRGVRPSDHVQGRCAGIGLGKSHLLALTDAEVIPLDDSTLCALIDQHGPRRGCLHCGSACGHLRASRQIKGR